MNNNTTTTYYDLDPQTELAPFQDQDLRLLKAITSDQRLALDFVNSHDPNLFVGEAKQVGRVIFDYIKAYKTIPTKRVLVDSHKDSKIISQVEALFDILPSVTFDPTEYQYDVEKIRQRYVDTRYHALKDDIQFGKMSPDQTMQSVEQALKDIKRIKQPSRTAYTQKSIDEYLPEFQKEYVARIENPELGQGILTGYSYLDYVTNGLGPAELFIVAAETGGGKTILLNNISIHIFI